MNYIARFLGLYLEDELHDLKHLELKEYEMSSLT